MGEEPTSKPGCQRGGAGVTSGPIPLRVQPSPHVFDTRFTTRRMMLDVLVALVPAVAVSLFLFRWYAVVQVGLCVLACLGGEALFSRMRGRALPWGDLSATVTGVILGLSLPWSAPWYIPVLAGLVAIGLGKAAFGGLGLNLFNPAMVGRAFVMLSFARELGASAYARTIEGMSVVSQATPLTLAREGAESLALLPGTWTLFVGTHNGSLGETSTLACLLGGLYLVLRRAAAWEIPASVLGSAVVFAGLAQLGGLTALTVDQQLAGGALVFGAFFIATDPVSSPLTFRGKLVFGAGIGFFVVLLRVFSGYPEGVMFAVLLMNAATPLLNRWTVPRPLGGPVPVPGAGK